MSSGCRWPCTRTCGGELVVMWRSLPDMSSIFFSKSLRVTFMVPFFPSSNVESVDGLARHFFERGDAVRDLDQAAAAKGDHAPLHRLFLQLYRGRAHQDQFTYFVVNFHDFVKS